MLSLIKELIKVLDLRPIGDLDVCPVSNLRRPRDDDPLSLRRLCVEPLASSFHLIGCDEIAMSCVVYRRLVQ